MEFASLQDAYGNTPAADVAMVDESAAFQKRMTVDTSLPVPKKMTAPTPKFFGAEPFTNPNDDAMAPFNGNVNRPNGYMLDADFTKSFDLTGVGRSSGATLPVPELRHRWKALSPDGGSQEHGDMTAIAAMKSKLDSLMARLDDLEYRAAGANPQLEMLSFIMTGLFLMFILDLAVRSR